jgi:replication-associated recombination protein RarA
MTDEQTWHRPIPHWSTDPFASRTTIHGLASDEVRSALHKHVRRGSVEQAVRAAVELARTDAEHEAEMWRRLQVLAAEDVGMGDPMSIVIVRSLHEAARDTAEGAYDRLVFAAQAAGYLAASEKNPVLGEMMQVVLHEELAPEIPDEAVDVHTRRGQQAARTMYDWFVTGTAIAPETQDRDVSWRDRLVDVYRRLDPPRDES